jgi:protein-S-isoprenylcysteine O-methyltransferase Ste14
MDMQRLDALIPPPIVAGAAVIGMWLAAPQGVRALAPPALRLGLALALATAGAVFAGAGLGVFRRLRTTVNPHRPTKASALATGGVYRVTRNPMYLGLALVLAGFAAWLWWWPALAGPLAFGAYITRFQIRAEERALERVFGDEYRAYCRRVRRWL